MGKLYMFNAPIVPLHPRIDMAKVDIKRINLEDPLIREWVKRKIEGKKITGNFISAVGHEATAKLLSEVLGTEIPCNRARVHMDYGDEAFAFVLKTRLPEGYVIKDVSELKKIGYEFYYMRL